MFKIFDEYGHRAMFQTPSYEFACHVAHWQRERLGCELGVVDSSGRYISEACDIDPEMDAAAKNLKLKWV